jgi:hypothetical protein
MAAAPGATAAAAAMPTGPATASDVRFPTPKRSVTAGSAATSAPADCWGAGPTVTDHFSHAYTTQYCHNYRAGNVVRASRSSPTVNSGSLYVGDNWLACQVQLHSGENPPVGNARDNWRLRPQGDVGYSDGGRRYSPAHKLSGGDNVAPIPGLDYRVP